MFDAMVPITFVPSSFQRPTFKRPRHPTLLISTAICCIHRYQSRPSSKPHPHPFIHLTKPPINFNLNFNPAITAASLLIILFSITALPNITNAKNLLSENTIFRRYLITDSSAILRYSLPLPTDPVQLPIRDIQDCLERLGVHQRSHGVAGLIASRKDLAELQKLLTGRQLDVLLDVPAKYRTESAESLANLEKNVDLIRQELGDSGRVIGDTFLPEQAVQMQKTLKDAFTPRNSLKQLANYDAAYVESLRREALNHVSHIEELGVQGVRLPFRIPRRYNDLPRLLGRARVTFTIQKQNDKQFLDEAYKPIGKTITVTATLDGFSAPLTVGNFIDLTQRNVYNNSTIQASQKEFFAQFNPSSSSSSDRRVPLEILVTGEPSPVYGLTLDEAGIADLQPTLPVSAYGAMAMVHSLEDVNDATDGFYFFLLDRSSYQARSVGGSILTGSVATFGYVIEGQGFLTQLEVGDKIVTAKVVSGLENFRKDGNT